MTQEEEKQILDDFCKACECEHYIEWEFCFPHIEKSCKLQGESHHIHKIAEQCPFKQQIEKMIKERAKL